MNVAVLHYHLNRGGVTQVIANHLAALATAEVEAPRLAVLFGGRQDGWPTDRINRDCPSVQLRAVEGLDYDDLARVEASDLGRRVVDILNDLDFRPEDTVLHIHNHNLGKNLPFTQLIPRFAQLGYALLLQIHDFAEDFRPGNYRRLAEGAGDRRDVSRLTYPQAEQIHYAVLNGRDEAILLNCGLARGQIHRLPNPVADFDALPAQAQAKRTLAQQFGVPEDRRMVLYPVRGIRRKNVGEVLLWSALFPDAHFGITLPPQNPAERSSYDRWHGFARELGLACEFNLGAPGKLTYAENLAAADRIITTSVAEGFGLVFLESWLSGRALVGRDLPEITRDFVASGLRLPHLGRQVRVPVSWLDLQQLTSDLQSSYQGVLRDYGHDVPSHSDFTSLLEPLIADGTIDFAYLSSEAQAAVVRRNHGDSGSREALLAENAWMSAALQSSDESLAELIRHNAEVVRSEYSLPAFGQRLQSVYGRISQSQRVNRIESLSDGDRVLDAFLSLSRLHPIRIES